MFYIFYSSPQQGFSIFFFFHFIIEFIKILVQIFGLRKFHFSFIQLQPKVVIDYMCKRINPFIQGLHSVRPVLLMKLYCLLWVQSIPDVSRFFWEENEYWLCSLCYSLICIIESMHVYICFSIFALNSKDGLGSSRVRGIQWLDYILMDG